MLIAVDWGSSHLRALLLNANGKIVERRESDQGVLSEHIQRQDSDKAFADTLAQHCQTWFQQHGPLPCYLGGMVGSRNGWREISYLDSRQPLSRLSDELVKVNEDNCFLIPGVAQCNDNQAADVMRGEEIQILGALETLDSDSALLCLPGTHSKWAQTSVDISERKREAYIHSFSTFMTGELFQWARNNSSLSSLLDAPSQSEQDSESCKQRSFLAGVKSADKDHPLSQLLFSIRAQCLLGQLDDINLSEFLSGVIIGQEVRAGLRMAESQKHCSGEQPIVIIGNPTLTQRYQRALSHFQESSSYLDGEEAFSRGVYSIHQRRQNLNQLTTADNSQTTRVGL